MSKTLGYPDYPNLLVIFALEHYSLTTALFPATIGLACLLFMLMLLVLRNYHKE